MKAIILVGGYGTRLRPLTLDCPKSLVPFCNLPMVEYQIRACAEAGVKEVILAINYQPESILAHIEPFQERYGLRIVCSKEEEALGTAGPLRLAGEMLRKDNPEGLFFVFNSDVICEFDLAGLLRVHRERKGLATICLKEVADPSRFGVVVRDRDSGQVERFVEKPKVFVGNEINAGIYLLSTQVLDRIPEGFCMVEKDVFPQLAQAGLLFSMTIPGFWRDIGQPVDFLIGQREFIDHLKARGSPLVSHNLSLVDPSAVIEQGAEVGPYAVVGPRCMVKQGCRVRNGCLLGGCRLERGCLVADSIVGWDNRLAAYCRLTSGSVTGREVSITEEAVVIGSFVLPQKTVGGNLLTPGTIVM